MQSQEQKHKSITKTARLTIEQKVIVEPQFFDNVTETIREKLSKKLFGFCTEENGYILKVYKNITILGNRISNTSCESCYSVRFDIECLKPEIENIYEAKILTLNKWGIFTSIRDRMKVVV